MHIPFVRIIIIIIIIIHIKLVIIFPNYFRKKIYRSFKIHYALLTNLSHFYEDVQN